MRSHPDKFKNPEYFNISTKNKWIEQHVKKTKKIRKNQLNKGNSFEVV